MGGSSAREKGDCHLGEQKREDAQWTGTASTKVVVELLLFRFVFSSVSLTFHAVHQPKKTVRGTRWKRYKKEYRQKAHPTKLGRCHSTSSFL